MPVARGGAPVHKDAKPGAVLDGKTGKTLSANAPLSMSLARLGNLLCCNSSCTNEGTAPSHARTIAFGAGWPWTLHGITQAATAMRYTRAANFFVPVVILDSLLGWRFYGRVRRASSR